MIRTALFSIRPQAGLLPTASRLSSIIRHNSSTPQTDESKLPVKVVPGEIFEADHVSGVPTEISHRTVRIFSPARTAMQQGTNKTDDWRIEFEVQDRWENPLMGWASSGDPVQATTTKFLSKEDAIRFAERQGYDYFVEEPQVPKPRKANYSENFKYNPNKLRYIKTK
ncbi:hypothetical protein SmJEL517_g03013 [Synchytrium microbalum]|uniref:NADH dehydrogenase [ubiquinone] iron-sulfur protein 4, mitochondrial n=1 Tax=Synchytrium microbalum TaxID=1806994 RepID=A0A507C3R0_9FUNG|nr:uncharacterized protein SmJEL517_g03013 [Synchytrium microbalum]TPX34312.1 hypothetical protein SmJEL517_g03013 [Synchytrium microbalum]